MINRETIEKILDATQIVDVIGEFVSLKRRGANYVACCPFHDEKTPSFSVSPSKGIFKCFGCGKGGDAVHFIMEHEHLSYPEALKWLAAKYNIEVVEKEETAEDIAQRMKSESMMLVNEFAAKYFVHELFDTMEGRAVGLRKKETLRADHTALRSRIFARAKGFTRKRGGGKRIQGRIPDRHGTLRAA